MVAFQQMEGRYELLELVRADMVFEEYAGTDRSTLQPVFVKLIRKDVSLRSIEARFRYRKLAEGLQDFANPCLMRLRTFGVWQDRDAMIYDCPGENLTPLSQGQAAWPQGLLSAVELIGLIAGGLDQAHQAGLLHQSLNPESVLTSWDAGRPQVLIRDFGNYLLLDLTQIEGGPAIRNVFGYLAPEQTGILRKPIDARSDVYALGIMFYELLGGRLPYCATDINTLIYQHIAQHPPSLRALCGDCPPVLEQIVRKMIAKDPSDRYQSLMGVIADLDTFRRRQAEGETSPDFELALSERIGNPSFSTKLVGRDKELSRLRGRLKKLGAGQGMICFIESDPGGGKSRLADELREDVYGMHGLYLSGKCEPFASQTTCKALVAAIESYVEKVKRFGDSERGAHAQRMKTVLGERAEVLFNLCPAVGELVGLPPPMVELEPEKQRLRFLVTLSEFLLALGTPSRPVVIHLDDLQWADDVTLDLLERVAPQLNQASLTILATFRSNEVPAEHRLREMAGQLEQEAEESCLYIALSDLDREAVTELVAQVFHLNDSASRLLSAHLMERIGGNPFCVLEALKILFDQGVIHRADGRYVCDAALLERADIPIQVMDIILRHMDGLPENSLSVLSCAAIVGKDVDLQQLAACAGKSPDELLPILDEAINSRLLTRDPVDHGRMQFVHDRVREAFYGRLSPDERTRYHVRAAEFLESAFRSRTDLKVYELAYHYFHGGVKDKALKYSLAAALKAKKTFSHAMAKRFYETALALLEEQDLGHAPEYVDSLEALGETYWLSGQYDKAVDTFEKCEQLVGERDVLRRVRIISKKADALHELGSTQESLEATVYGLGLLRVRMPRHPALVKLFTLKEFAVQLVHIWFSRWLLCTRPCTDLRDLSILRLLIRISYISYFIDVKTTFWSFLKAVNYAERKGVCMELVELYIGGGTVWSTVPVLALARRSLERGLNVARQIGYRVQEAGYHAYYSVVHEVGNRPVEGLQHAEQAARLVRELGDWWYYGVAVSTGCHLRLLMGQLRKAEEECETLLRYAQDMKMRYIYGWMLLDKIHIAAFLGKGWDELFAQREEFFSVFRETQQYSSVGSAWAHLGWMRSLRGEHREAAAYIEKAFEVFPGLDAQTWTLWAYPMGAQVYLNAIRAGDTPERLLQYRRRARWFCRQSWRLAKKFRYIQGWAYQVNGAWLWIHGRHGRARALWQRGVRYLEEQTRDLYRLAQIRMEEGGLRLERQPDDRAAYEYLLEARDLFERCETPYFREQAETLLDRFRPEGGVVEPNLVLTQKRYLESLLSSMQAIGSVFNLEELLNRMVCFAREATGAERGFVLLREGADGPCRLRVAEGLTEDLQNRAFSYEEYGMSLGLVDSVQWSCDGQMEQAASDSAIGRELSAAHIKQALCVPLLVREKMLGVLYLDTAMSYDVFTAGDMGLMKAFGIQAAVAIENVQLVKDLLEQDRIKRELQIGRDIQTCLLPKATPAVKGLKVCGLMQPAKEIGGDYYDFIERTRDGRAYLGVAIGDVSGKGVGAGLAMAMVKTAIASYAQEGLALMDILAKANRVMFRSTRGSLFVSAVYLEWAPEERLMRFCGAGHEHVLIYRAATGRVEAIPSGGIVLGIRPEIGEFLSEKTFEMACGDKVVLYTDGVTEAFNLHQEEYGFERFQKAVARCAPCPVEELPGLLRAEVSGFAGECEQNDDITLVAMECVP
ncbi:MAG TPA: hypothetical protein DCZ95_15420 [Verrucomicrobia bacterium]|nr:MAG: hypothetical protein A2X46_08130 [Lentisphaerae bacterium GWF2_57_35]HBA85475.1 hypothetical protein [Verrucomicrobiota bacterium]